MRLAKRILSKLNTSNTVNALKIKPAHDATDLVYHVDQFSLFDGIVFIKGWAFHKAKNIREIYFAADGRPCFALADIGLASEDVANAHGRAGKNSRFIARRVLKEGERPLKTASLFVVLSDGKSIEIPASSASAASVNRLHDRFLNEINAMSPGHFLEIGSRARSSIVRKGLIPEAWQYTGFDVLQGENVDVVGDAHHLSKFFPMPRFHGVWALSVLEHILMPWRFVIELNRVMELGGVGFFSTHQCWPMHDRPWDFWRFSSDSWKALLNKQTGFEIVDVQMGEPAFMVANYWHPVVDFADGGFLASAVMFRKIAETKLTWDVEPSDILDSDYPA